MDVGPFGRYRRCGELATWPRFGRPPLPRIWCPQTVPTSFARAHPSKRRAESALVGSQAACFKSSNATPLTRTEPAQAYSEFAHQSTSLPRLLALVRRAAKRKLWSPRPTLQSSDKNVTHLPPDIWGANSSASPLRSMTLELPRCDSFEWRGTAQRNDPQPPDRLLRRVDDAPHRQHGSARPTVEGLRNVNATTFC